MWHIQSIPTARMWVPPPLDEDPVEELSTELAGNPDTAVEYAFEDHVPDENESLGTAAHDPDTAFADSNVYAPDQSEPLSTRAHDPTAAVEQVWIFQSGEDSLATANHAPTTAVDYIYVDAPNGEEGIATAAHDPTTAVSP